jgi:protein-tyrosine phosphatase
MELVACEKKPIFNHIYKNMYLGDIVSAQDSECVENIDEIYNLSNSRYSEKQRIKYHHIDIEDNRNVDLTKYFEMFDKLIAKSTGNILIHCQNGVSRSVSFMIYYLMKYDRITMKEAYEIIRVNRTQYTRPNIGFFRQLLRIEQELFGKTTMTMRDIYTVKQTDA